MKPLSEMTHYEVLEISPGAAIAEVERAYRMAQATWGEGGLATYSVYEEGEAEAIRERVELAFRVLSDPEEKAVYDGGLGGTDLLAADDFEIDLQFVDSEPSSSVDFVAAEIETFEDAADETGDWNGARLRRARLRRGINLEKIADVTKINPTYLRFIEDDQYEHLPARVYVRGFVVAYARCLGLDPERVAAGYLAIQGEEPRTPQG